MVLRAASAPGAAGISARRAHGRTWRPVPSPAGSLYGRSMGLHLVDDSDRPVDVSLAGAALRWGVLAGVLCALIGQLTVPAAALVAAPPVVAVGVWLLARQDRD